MKKLTLLAGLFLLSIANAFAQAYQGRQDNFWSIGFQLNAMNYFGDLNPKAQYISNRIDHTRPSLFIHASKRFGPRIRLRASLGYARLKGSDFEAAGNFSSASGDAALSKISRYGRGLHFRNDIQELAFAATYDFVKSYGRFYRRKAIVPYALLGVAVFHHNPKAIAPEGTAEAGKWVALQPLGTEGQGKDGYDSKYSLFQVTSLIGGGIRFRVTDRIDIGAEIGWRFTFTNYLDDVGGRYADLKDLDTDLARRMADRSAESTDALTGKSRDLAAIAPTVGGVSPNYGGEAPYPRTAGQGVPDGYYRLGSYGLKGDKRASGTGFLQKDVYVATGVHLYYILTSKRHPRYSGN